MKYLLLLFPIFLFADAKGEIQSINELLEKKYTHKVEYINKNTQRLLNLEVEEVLLIKKLIRLKENLIKMNTIYRYQNENDDIFAEPNKI